MTVPPSTTDEAPDLEALPDEDLAKEMPLLSEEDFSPLRFNATRVPERLSASHSSFFGSSSSSQASKRRGSLPSSTKPRSRSVSPSLRTAKSDSSVSSLEDVDADILTDRMGLEELDMEKTKAIMMAIADSVSALPPVNERLSEDTLEDVHAFSDVSAKNSSRANSIATGAEVASLLLETLDECDDEEDEHEVVHISNLDEIKENEDHEDDEVYYFTTEDLPPLRFNACRVRDKLSETHSALPPHHDSYLGHHHRSHSLPDKTNFVPRKEKDTYSVTSLDEDILTDRMGLMELDTSDKQRSCSSINAVLAPVTERMSEETLEDVHAFTDVRTGSSVASSVTSRAGSVAGEVGSYLEPLDEEDEMDDDDKDLVEEIGVHISNIENVSFHNYDQIQPSDVSNAPTT